MRFPLAIAGLALLAGAFSTVGAMDPEAYVKHALDSNKVQVFSKSYCPHCKNTKQLLTGLGISFNADELDQMHDGPQIQQELMKLTGQRTVPNVFINGKHLGGNDDLMAARNSGKLKTLLQGAGVTFGEEL